MYDVLATLKIYLEDPSKSAEVKKHVEALGKVQKIDEQEIGFGIKVLMTYILLKDSEGGADVLEEKIAKISGVSQVQVEEVTRV